MTYRVTKTYGHDLGISCAFRQWRAKSHCRFIHGYALSFELIFEAQELDEHGWVIDFGSLQPVKDMLFSTFDHKLLIARDDPSLKRIQALGWSGLEVLADCAVVDRVGCEAFAGFVFEWVELWLKKTPAKNRVTLLSVKVSEHGGNSATFLAGE